MFRKHTQSCWLKNDSPSPPVYQRVARFFNGWFFVWFTSYEKMDGLFHALHTKKNILFVVII